MAAVDEVDSGPVDTCQEAVRAYGFERIDRQRGNPLKCLTHRAARQRSGIYPAREGAYIELAVADGKRLDVEAPAVRQQRGAVAPREVDGIDARISAGVDGAALKADDCRDQAPVEGQQFRFEDSGSIAPQAVESLVGGEKNTVAGEGETVDARFAVRKLVFAHEAVRRAVIAVEVAGHLRHPHGAGAVRHQCRGPEDMVDAFAPGVQGIVARTVPVEAVEARVGVYPYVAYAILAELVDLAAGKAVAHVEVTSSLHAGESPGSDGKHRKHKKQKALEYHFHGIRIKLMMARLGKTPVQS